MKHKHHSSRKRIAVCLLAATSVLSLLTGCVAKSPSDDEPKPPESVQAAVQNIQSVETSIALDMHGRFTGGGSDAHTASIKSDVTIRSNLSPEPAYHAEYYSSILVDGATTRESREIYVVPENGEYVSYKYNEASDEWHKSVMNRGDALSIPCETGFIHDWDSFMANMTESGWDEKADGSIVLTYTGKVDASVLQEFFGNNVFGTFMYSVEQLINESIPCTMIVDGKTMLPDKLTLTFHNEWKVSDMSFDTADVTVYYSKWNRVEEVTADKRVTVMATDPEAAFYSNYYAWNLFLPYVGGQMDEPGSAGNTDQSFTSAWNTFQVRIDGGMTSLPLPYEDLQKLGYSIDGQYSSIIMEPNKYKEGVVLNKGNDKLICTLYNDDTVPQPITSCKIGCIDLSSSNVLQNGIQIYLPGEVTLGISKEALLSAYGTATQENHGFSCDTYTWKGEGDMQSFMAETSPKTGQVIRIQVKNIPVTGGPQI